MKDITDEIWRIIYDENIHSRIFWDKPIHTLIWDKHDSLSNALRSINDERN